MCRKTYQVMGLDSPREAHEVEQYLKGIPSVADVRADSFEDTVTVEWDEHAKDEATILDEIEHSGCKPSDRVDGFFEKLKMRLA